MNKLGIVSILLFLCAPAFSQLQGTLIGQDSANKIITTAVPFLTITPDSRAAAMGDAGVATSPDANSAYWNAGSPALHPLESYWVLYQWFYGCQARHVRGG